MAMMDRLESKKNLENILDVGVGTGHPLYSIIDRIPSKTNVLGIDYDASYI